MTPEPAVSTHFLNAYLMLSPAINTGHSKISKKWFLTSWPKGNWRGSCPLNGYPHVAMSYLVWRNLTWKEHLKIACWAHFLWCFKQVEGAKKLINLLGAMTSIANTENIGSILPIKSQNWGKPCSLMSRMGRHFGQVGNPMRWANVLQ